MLAPIALVAVGLVFSPAPQRSFSTVAVRPRRASGIVCGWGPDPVWSALTIASIVPVWVLKICAQLCSPRSSFKLRIRA